MKMTQGGRIRTSIWLIARHCKRDWWNYGAKQEFSQLYAGNTDVGFYLISVQVCMSDWLWGKPLFRLTCFSECMISKPIVWVRTEFKEWGLDNEKNSIGSCPNPLFGGGWLVQYNWVELLKGLCLLVDEEKLGEITPLISSFISPHEPFYNSPQMYWTSQPSSKELIWARPSCPKLCDKNKELRKKANSF